MSSTGQALGYVVGAVAGYFTGGASYVMMGAAIGGAVGAAIDPPKGPHLQGPRLSDLSGQTCSYGTVIPRVYGTVGLYGNVFWLENNALKEVATDSEAGGKGGGGGATTTSYSYYATFAVGLCQGPITGIRRLWVGDKLIFDAASDDLETIISGSHAGQYWTLYTGSETQQPDPRMQAALGIANTPAFRGLAYIVFNDYPLAEHGNSLLGAQVKVEVVTAGSYGGWVKHPLVSQNTGSTYTGQIGIPLREHRAIDGLLFRVLTKIDGGYSNPGFDVSEIYHWGMMTGRRLLPNSNYFLVPTRIESDAIIVAGSYGFERAYCDGVIHYTAFTQTLYGSEPNVSVFRRHGVLAAAARYGTLSGLSFSTTERLILYRQISSSTGFRFFFDYDASVLYVLYKPTSGSVTLDAYDWPSGDAISSQSFPSYIEKYGNLFVYDGVLYDTFSESGYSFLYKYRLSDLSYMGYEATPIVSGASLEHAWMDPGGLARATVIHNNVTADFLTRDRLTIGTTLLSDIVAAECAASGVLESGDVQTSGLASQAVRGYRIGSIGAIRSAIEPLQGAWPFDVVQAGYQIKFVPRGQSVVATVPATETGAAAWGERSAPRLIIKREMDTQLPASVGVKYLDPGREYEQNEQLSERLNTDAINLRIVDVPIVLSADEAAAVSEKLLYLYWLERYDLQFTLSPAWRHLEPADVIVVETDHGNHELRLVQVAYQSNGTIDCTARYNNAAIYASTASGDAGQQGSDTIPVAGPSLGLLLDIPCLFDSMNTPGFLASVCGYTDGWNGGVLVRSDDGGQVWSSLRGFVPPGATVGYLISAPAAPLSTALIDKATRFSVKLFSGELSSVSEGQMLNGANHFAVGADGRWEIIAAQNCILQGDGSYILSDLLRGRFGTEWATAGHQTGDKIVLLNAVGQDFIGMSANSIGAERLYRAVTTGKPLSSASNQAFTYRGVNLECLSPVYLNGNRDSGNNWTLTWTRRTRLGGEWRDLVDSLLSETSEAYEVEIYTSAAYTTLKRTIAGLTAAGATYTSAQQVTDFGSNQATLYVKVYQLSANVGRGYPLTTSITR